MKIVYQNVISLVFFVAYNYMSLADNHDAHVYNGTVVAFFDEKSSQAQIAFHTALANFKQMQGRNSDISFHGVSANISLDSFDNSNILCNYTANNFVGAVLCPKSAKIAPIIESLCLNLEIPAIQVHWRLTAQYNNITTINFYPYQKLLFEGLGVVVKNLQWRSIVVFYESKEGLIQLQNIMKLQNFDSKVQSNSVTLIELGPGPDYRYALKQIQNKTEHRIVLDCKTEKIIPILKQAKRLGLLEKRYSYFFTSLDAHTVDLSILGTEANITTVRIINPEGSSFDNAVSRWKIYAEEHGTNADLEPYSIETETAITYDAIKLFIDSADQLYATEAIKPQNINCRHPSSWADGFRIVAYMKKKDFKSESLNSITGPMKFDEFGRRINFTLHIVEGNRGEVKATWNPGNGDRLDFLKSEEDREKELERKWRQGVITVATIPGAPYLMEKEPGKKTEYIGFSRDLMDELSNFLNFSYKLDVREDKLRGAYNAETKSWDGLMQRILEREAELAICDLTITPQRREYVDFSSPFMHLGISILYKKPEVKEANMYAFLDPLNLDLWMTSATIFLAITIVLYFIARVSPTDWENPHPCESEPEELENIWDIKNCMWLTLGSIMNQGCDILPKGAASRFVTVMWWFYAIIVTNSYMANLAAFLTNERNQGSITSVEDLAKQTKVKYGTLEGGSTKEFFQHSNYSVYQRMWTSMEQARPSVFEKSNDDGVARVQNSKPPGYAFLMESATLEYQIQTKCDLMQVGNWLDSKSYGIAMPLDYPHRSSINKALLKLQENGVIKKLKERWWKLNRGTEKLCPETIEEASSNKLALQNVGGVFLVLAVGIALSYIVGILEFLWNVRNVSVEEHISFKEALIMETKFALNVTITKKRAKPQASESSSQSSHSRSIARSILQGAGSFLHLDVLGKHHGTPGSSRHTSRHSSRPLD